MRQIKEAWVIEATCGTEGVSENTFRWAVVSLESAKTEKQAIDYVGASEWTYSGGPYHKSQTSVFATRGYVFSDVIGREGSGAPGSFGTPEIDATTEVIEAAASGQVIALGDACPNCGRKDVAHAMANNPHYWAEELDCPTCDVHLYVFPLGM